MEVVGVGFLILLGIVGLQENPKLLEDYYGSN